MRRNHARPSQRFRLVSSIAMAVAISMTIGRASSRTPGAGKSHAASKGPRKQPAPGPVCAGMVWIPVGESVAAGSTSAGSAGSAGGENNKRPRHRVTASARRVSPQRHPSNCSDRTVTECKAMSGSGGRTGAARMRR